MGVQDEGVGLVPFDHEEITVADSAVGLTPGTYLDAIRAEMTLEEGSIRILTDGTDPTSSEGRLAEIGYQIRLYSAAQIAGFRATRKSGTSGKLTVEYFH